MTNVFYAGDEHGIMCQLEAPSAKHPSATLVAPIGHIAFDLRHPIPVRLLRIANAVERRKNTPPRLITVKLPTSGLKLTQVSGPDRGAGRALR